MYKGKVVDCDLLLESCTLDLFWLAEIDWILDTRVQVYAVDIGILACGPGAPINDFPAAVEVYAYSFTKPGMLLRSPISRLAEAAFSLPCSLTNVSRQSCRRPAAITFEPSFISRLAMACPIPDVAPITST